MNRLAVGAFEKVDRANRLPCGDVFTERDEVLVHARFGCKAVVFPVEGLHPARRTESERFARDRFAAEDAEVHEDVPQPHLRFRVNQRRHVLAATHFRRDDDLSLVLSLHG